MYTFNKEATVEKIKAVAGHLTNPEKFIEMMADPEFVKEAAALWGVEEVWN